MILFNMKTSSSKIIATLFILFAVYILGCGNSFAVDFTYANDPISIVIYEGEGNTIVRLEMNFNDVSGSLSIVDSSGILLDDYLYDDYFDTYDYSDMTGFSMESWNADLIANILSDTSTLHTLTFPADSLQDGSTYNSNPITIEFYTPVQLDSVTANSGDNFTLDVTVTTPAGTMVAAVAKRFDFEQEYPFNDSYDTLTPQLLSGGFLSEFSGEIVDASNSFAASSGMKTLAGLDLDTPYTVMVYTELPSTSGNNHGSRLFTGTILEGMQYASGETRPVLVTEDAISTYKFNQSDASGYDVYIVLLFQDNIFSDALTASGQPALPYGIDLNVIMQNSEFTSLANQDGTAEIIDNKLILKLQDNIFSDSNTFSLRIPAGTVKNTSGYANEDIEVLTEFTLSDNSMVLNQIKPGSISQNIDSSSNQISMMLTEPGMIFNSFVEGPDFNTSDLFNTTTSVEDTDYEINVPNTLEFLTVPAGDTKVGTTFTNLTPETDYWWITTVHLNDPTKEIMEGQIYHFTTAASPPSMEMQGIEYCTGDTSAVAGDDSVYINFSQSLTNIGSASDYSVYVDYDSDDTLDVTISPSDYTLVQDLQAGMTDNQVRLIFGDEMASALDNIYNAQIKVAVANLTNIEPNVTASGTTYLYVDVPGRCADIHQPALIDSMTSANYPVMDFDVDTVSYTVPILPSDYSSMISNGSMAAFPVDNNASVYPTSDGYGVFSLQVTAETGNIVKTYTATASSDKFLLSDLSVNGTTLPLFTPNGFYDYEIPLPAGTTDLPTVEWALDSPTPPGVDTEMEVTGDLSTEAIVTIYTIDLETNDTIHSYRLLFTTEASVNLNLATLSLSTTEYGEIPFDTMNHTEGTVDFHLPSSLYESILNNSTFVGTAENPTATVTLPTVGAETTVTVTDPVTSSSKTYNVTINSSDKFLADIKLNGTSLDGFCPFEKAYNITLPEGATVPSVAGILDAGATTTVQTSSETQTSGSNSITTYTLDVLEESAIVNTYTVCFTVPSESTPTQLVSAVYNSGSTGSVNGDDTIILTFSNPIICPGSVSDYTVTLDKNSDGTNEVVLPTSDYTVTSGPDGVVVINFQGSSEYRVENIYNAQYIVDIVNPSNLTPSIEGTMTQTAPMLGRNPWAKSFTLLYEGNKYVVKVPYPDHDYVGIPVVTGDLSDFILHATLTGETVDPDATMVIPSVFSADTLVTVTAAEGHVQKTYTVDPYEDSTFPTALISNGTALSNFTPYKTEYDVVLPYGTTTLPTVTATLADNNNEFVVRTSGSGSLATSYLVTVDITFAHETEYPFHTYYIKYTVDPTAPTTDGGSSSNTDNDGDSGSNSGTSTTTSITSSINTITTSSLTGTLSTSTGVTSGTITQDAASQVASVLAKVQTASAAKTVLQQLPSTLTQLSAAKQTLTSDADKENLDKGMADLINSTERLVALINQPDQSKSLVKTVIQPLGDYYKGIDPKSLASKNLMNSAIKLSNAAITQAGTVNTSWDNVKIEQGGRVDLTPSPNQIIQAARNAAQTEAELETQLSESLEGGLENAIISTVTLKMPDSLKNAPKTAAGLNAQTMTALKDNNIEKVNLDLGAVSFGIDDKFIEAQQSTDLSFNVDRERPLSEADRDRMPKGSHPVGAPVVNLSATQNKQANDTFNHPLDVSFHLDQFDNVPKDPTSLGIFRLNESTNNWEPVGGVYDPATNSIHTKRTHLSKYTVLQSEKNYSNIEDSWAKNEIASLKGKGIIEDDELFTASDNVTREEFAGWIAKAYGLDSSTMETDLSDLDKDSPYYGAVAAAYQQGIISGKADGTFDPKGDISKEEMAVMIASAMNKYDYTVDTNTFELAQYEEDLPTWAVNSVETVVENGAVDESFFGSAGSVTKEEAAAILYQVYR